MSNYSDFEQFKAKKLEAEQEKKKIKNKAIIITISCILLTLWVVLYFAMFITKGIYVNDNFYKKQPNITSVTYTSVSKKETPTKIVLNKNIDNSATVTIDSNVIIVKDITKNNDGTVNSFNIENYNEGDVIYGVTYEDIGKIVTQELEGNRGNIVYFVLSVLIMLIVIVMRFNSAKVYYLIKKDKAPTESYHKFFDYLVVITVVALVVMLTISL